MERAGAAGSTYLQPILRTLLRTKRRRKSNRPLLASFREEL
jgi:hypothetical protein